MAILCVDCEDRGLAIYGQVIFHVAWVGGNKGHGMPALDPMDARMVMPSARDPDIAIVLVNPVARVADGPRPRLHGVLRCGGNHALAEQGAHFSRNAGKAIQVRGLRRRS